MNLNGLFSRMLFAGAAIICGIALSSCGNTEPKCSSQETKDVLQSILVKKNVKEIFMMSLGDSAKTVDVDVVNIITTEQKPNSASCKASLEIVITLKSGEKKTAPTDQTGFTYTAERTDDGKLYVTAYGL